MSKEIEDAFAKAQQEQVDRFKKHMLTACEEVTTLAHGYRELLKKADEAHAILMQILAKHGATGEEIKKKYLEELSLWASQHTAPVTCDKQLNLFGPTSIPSVGEISNSTKLRNGEDSPSAS